MRVLWIVNTIFPDAAIKLGIPTPVVGGWMYGLASDLTESKEIRLAVATVYPGKRILAFESNGIRYYLLPKQSKATQSKQLADDWRTVKSDFLPDIIHIHGTEYEHGMAMMNAHPELTYYVSIQGLVSVCHRYFLAGMSHWDVIRNITIRDIIGMDTLFNYKHTLKKRGIVEKEYISRATAVIGRTDWDRAHVYSINPEATYYACNESLRNEFYAQDKWEINNCRRHSIFLSQATSPIKGLHQLLKAAAIIKNEYPSLLIEIAGPDITDRSTFRKRIKLGGYGKYILRLIKELGLKNHIRFLGALQSAEIKKAYLRAHVFICPSSIENSSNSLAEAQILGVPCISSYCGGTPSMKASDLNPIYYPFDEYEILAMRIKSIFDDDSLSELSGASGISQARSRHSREKNAATLIKIYNGINEDAT